MCLLSAFPIRPEGDFGTINNFRLGRLPKQPVESDEVNAAWGQACFLLHTMTSYFHQISASCRVTSSEKLSQFMNDSKTKKRNFTETIELQIGLKNYDPQKNKHFSGVVKLPHITRPKMKICMLGDAHHVEEMPHLATTYAAVNSLITLRSDTALSSIKRDQLYKFLLRMKDSSGAFRMHDRGEIDVRACYTAISVASILNILDSELIRDVGKYILSCQTYEGGIAGEPGSEAHGGYTFCGLATMIITNEADKLDLPSLIDWVASRQGVECGFQGRTNKLVDGCYSFWQGAVLALVQRLPILNKELEVQLSEDNECSTRSSSLVGEGTDIDENVHGIETSHYESECTTQRSSLVGEGTYPDENLHGVWTSQYELKGDASSVGFTFIRRKNGHGPLFHSIALQQYVLLCSQALQGGFKDKDKPGKHPDFYHTCYCLSGLSSSQYSWSNDSVAPLPQAILGPYSNLL